MTYNAQLNIITPTLPTVINGQVMFMKTNNYNNANYDLFFLEDEENSLFQGLFTSGKSASSLALVRTKCNFVFVWCGSLSSCPNQSL